MKNQLPSRRTSAALLALGAALSLPSAASAATATADFATGELAYVAAPGELNSVQIDSSGGQLRVRDDGAGGITLTTLGDGDCRPTGAQRLRCVGLAFVSVDLGDGADSADLSKLTLPATVVAGSGSKQVTAGAGDDRIFVRNGAVDEVSCGAGVDVVVADALDVLAADCEPAPAQDAPLPVEGDASGDQASPADEPTGAADDGAPPIGVPIGVVLPDAPVTIAEPGRAVVQLGCAAAAASTCRGDLTIRARVRVRKGGKVVAREIGRRSFTVRRGDKVALPVRIHYRGHHTLVTRRRRGRAKLTIVQRDAAGKVLSRTTRSVTIVVPKHRWSRRRGRRN